MLKDLIEEIQETIQSNEAANALLERRLKEKLAKSLAFYQKQMEGSINWILTRANHKVIKTMNRLNSDKEKGTVYEPNN